MKNVMKTTARRMVAEFERQADAYMIWPERPDNWRNGGKPAQAAFARLASLINEVEPVTMLVSNKQYLNARKWLPKGVRVVEMSADDAFVKDTGPVYVDENGRLAATDFGFNAWGGLLDGLYFPWANDQLLGQKLAELNRVPYTVNHELIIEGCAIMTDGQGTLITTEDVLLSEGRNPGFTKAEVEFGLKQELGISTVIWLKHGYFLDETNGDIDNMLNYIRPGEVVLTWTEDEADPMYSIVREAETTLLAARDAQGRKLVIHHLTMPAAQHVTQAESQGIDPINGLLPRLAGQRLFASYVNFVTVNDMIIVPEFDDEQDAIAKATLAKCFPDRRVVGFDAREMILGGGNIHTVVHTRPDAAAFGG
ncbi:agmatine deiminase [Furfurilactobacillus sp. WILCCON 0119]